MKRFIVFSLLCIAAASLVYFCRFNVYPQSNRSENAKVPVREEVTIRYYRRMDYLRYPKRARILWFGYEAKRFFGGDSSKIFI